MAKDTIHDAVKKAIIEDGWTIIADPFRMEYGSYRRFADLAAERAVAAERDGRKIIVEIKTFSDRSFIKAFQQALGQYKLYLDVLALTNLDDDLYLAISALLNAPPAPPYEIALVFDDQHNHYLIREVGWTEKGRVRETILHLAIRNGKIWIEEDWTEEGIATFLVEHGIPNHDIVLGFQPPDIREYSVVAVA